MVHIPKIEREGNVSYEGFAAGASLQHAKRAMAECKRGATLAADTVRTANLLNQVTPMNLQRLRVWYGLKVEAQAHAVLYSTLRRYLLELESALRARPITLVYRPDIVVKHLPEDRKLPPEPLTLGDGRAYTGQNVYGYVHHHQAGSGMRIVCGKPFETDATPHYDSTTIYHELTHKVFASKDHVYGDVGCKALATNTPGQAIDNADNYAYYVISLFTRRI